MAARAVIPYNHGMVDNRTIVITGATRGIGYGLAGGFLKAGCRVFICGRSEETTAHAVAELAACHGQERVGGRAADVSDFRQVEALWNAALDRFGQVDIWVNNAGLGAVSQRFWQRTPEQIRRVVETNVIGLMNGTRVALAGMLEAGGFIYNMEGLGSSGPVIAGTALYGSTKAAVTRFTRAIVKDVADTQVKVGFISPGMVITELFTGPNEEEMTPSFRRLANILADRVETVGPWLVQGMLKNTRNGARIDWLTNRKIAWRFLTAPFRRNRLFPVQ